MKHLIFLLLSLLFACSHKHPDAVQKHAAKPAPQLSIQQKEIEAREESPLFDSLTAGFNLHDLLEKMQFRNSGGSTREIYYFRPQRAGFYYSYFGSSHFSGDIYGKLMLTTYVYGDHVGRYNEQEEEFIALECRVKDAALGKLNLVGRPSAVFRNHPATVYKSEKGMILQENEQALKLICKNDTIHSFEYVRIKNPYAAMTRDERNALRH